jgi:hypothetical protein
MGGTMQRRRRTAAGLAAVIAAAAVGGAIPQGKAANAAGSRALGECIRDLAGNGGQGSLTYDTEYFLSLQSINLSDWTGNHDYAARRYDSGFNQTYVHLEGVDSAGAPQEWTYGTAGNTTRMTSIETLNSQGLSSWSEFESAIC